MPPNFGEAEKGRVHKVKEVKIGLSRSDYSSLLLVRRHLQDKVDNLELATPHEMMRWVTLMWQALTLTQTELYFLKGSTNGPTYEDEQDTWWPDEDEL